MSGTFTTRRREGQNVPIIWADATGVTHSVEGAEVHPGVTLLWTRCGCDVPANSAVAEFKAATCPDCTPTAIPKDKD